MSLIYKEKQKQLDCHKSPVKKLLTMFDIFPVWAGKITSGNIQENGRYKLADPIFCVVGEAHTHSGICDSWAYGHCIECSRFSQSIFIAAKTGKQITIPCPTNMTGCSHKESELAVTSAMLDEVDSFVAHWNAEHVNKVVSI